MKTLPTGWAETTLGDLCVWGSGGTPKRSEPSYFGGGIPWVTISDLNDGVVTETAETLSLAGLRESSAKQIPAGVIMVALYGSIGKLGISGKPSTTNQAIAYALPNDDSFDAAYLFHYLRAKREDLASLGSGVTQKNIYLGDIKRFAIPLPPRAEQARIVSKLQELLSDLDAGVAELKAAQKKLAQQRQLLLKEAVEGALTTEWRKHTPSHETGAQLLQRVLAARRAHWNAKQLSKFKEQSKTPPKDWQDKYPEPIQPDLTSVPKLPPNWAWASLDMLGELASGVAKGTKRSPDVPTREVPYLRVANVQRGYLDLSEVKTILASEQDVAELALQSGDVLFNEGGDRDKLGRGWVWRDEVAQCIHQNHVFRMRLFVPEMVPELVSHHGNTFGKTWFQRAGKQTTNLASINMTMLRKFPVPLAPIVEQHELLSQLQLKLETLHRQEQVVEYGLKQSTAQRKNILNAAFCGQLVQQDPNDEPASELLTRIRVERAQQDKLPIKPRTTKIAKETAAVIAKLIDVLADAGDWVPAQEAFRRCGIADGARTDQIEALYAELRALNKAGRLAVEPVKDARGRKTSDRLKLIN